MQILEWSFMGLRAARINLVSSQSEIVITLFPMVHVADAAFFRDVYGDAFSHDVALIEGVRSPITLRITRVYRWIVGSRRLGLVLQPAWPVPGSVRARIVRADLSAEEFRLVWARVPVWLQWTLYLAAPAMGLWLRAFATRERIARRLSTDDQPSQKRLLSWTPESEALEAAMLDARDRRLIESLEAVLDDPDSAGRRVAIVWGAGHVPAVLRAVTGRRGYFAEHSTWMTVFGP